jgi:hypothetical protein
MSLAAFPHHDAPLRPRLGGGKLPSTTVASSLPLHPQPYPHINPFPESDFRCFPQMHTPSLQYKRYLFPLRNE